MAPRRPPQHLRRLLLSLVVGAHSLICTPALSSGGALRDQPCAHLRRTGAVSMGFFSEMFDELDRFIVCRGTSNQPRPSQHGSHSSPLLAAGPTYLRAARCVSAELSCSCVRCPRVQDDAAGRRLGNGAKFYGKRRFLSLLPCGHRYRSCAVRTGHAHRPPAACVAEA